MYDLLGELRNWRGVPNVNVFAQIPSSLCQTVVFEQRYMSHLQTIGLFTVIRTRARLTECAITAGKAAARFLNQSNVCENENSRY